jgi:hypothetical protein
VAAAASLAIGLAFGAIATSVFVGGSDEAEATPRVATAGTESGDRRNPFEAGSELAIIGDPFDDNVIAFDLTELDRIP